MPEIGTPGFPQDYPMGLTVPAKAAVVRPLRQALYDSEVTGTAALSEIQYFQRPQGTAMALLGTSAVTINKIASDTNMTQGGFLATPQQFAIFGFNYEIQSGTSFADFNLIICNGLFEFIFAGTRVYLQCPLAAMPQGCAPEGTFAMDGATAALSTISIHNGVGHVSNIYNFTMGRSALKIMPNEAFKVRCTFARSLLTTTGTITPSATTLTRVYIRGLLFNSI